MPYPKIPLEKRFWSRVEKTDGCWIWTGGRNEDGYGHIKRVWGEGSTGTHRVSWEIHYGPIPKGMNVLHKCDNPPCVRPDHLFLGTTGDNIRDREKKGRGNHVKGEKHGFHKLTEAEVIEIRRLYKSVKLSQPVIAKMFNVSRQCVQHIIYGDSWQWLEDKP